MSDDLYTAQTVDQWSAEKTMEHASGIWGRTPTLNLIKRRNWVKPGDKIVDFGCGAGFPSNCLAELTGDTGSVLGIDTSRPLLEKAGESYGNVQNLKFSWGDTTCLVEIDDEFSAVDVVTSFMVIHNLDSTDVGKVHLQSAVEPEELGPLWKTVTPRPFSP